MTLIYTILANNVIINMSHSQEMYWDVIILESEYWVQMIGVHSLLPMYMNQYYVFCEQIYAIYTYL